ncbi:class I SAM-dependent methyltransferase [Reichenbachiella versicolor]|uniref:class I SAM-dependent methyltransferase n=1 Tax=Reichenbachiella versicolor TaxID=1821036 RepID=UPI000D6DD3FD|nr:class I SAM-dependent methyltransferase [Reichenbachiella versicolor]
MNPNDTGLRYDKIASWWDDQHRESNYGMEAFERALKYYEGIKTALDVGCGAGGRFIKRLVSNDIQVHGIDVSKNMIDLAKSNHPIQQFEVQDISMYTIKRKYDLVYAWDSIFHLPLDQHRSVIKKMCNALHPRGIILYTFGNAEGEHTDQWMNDTFYYSSIGINENLKVLLECNIKVLHLELDQYPEKHVVVIGQRD